MGDSDSSKSDVHAVYNRAYIFASLPQTSASPVHLNKACQGLQYCAVHLHFIRGAAPCAPKGGMESLKERGHGATDVDDNLTLLKQLLKCTDVKQGLTPRIAQALCEDVIDHWVAARSFNPVRHYVEIMEAPVGTPACVVGPGTADEVLSLWAHDDDTFDVTATLDVALSPQEGVQSLSRALVCSLYTYSPLSKQDKDAAYGTPLSLRCIEAAPHQLPPERTVAQSATWHCVKEAVNMLQSGKAEDLPLALTLLEKVLWILLRSRSRTVLVADYMAFNETDRAQVFTYMAAYLRYAAAINCARSGNADGLLVCLQGSEWGNCLGTETPASQGAGAAAGPPKESSETTCVGGMDGTQCAAPTTVHTHRLELDDAALRVLVDASAYSGALHCLKVLQEVRPCAPSPMAVALGAFHHAHLRPLVACLPEAVLHEALQQMKMEAWYGGGIYQVQVGSIVQYSKLRAVLATLLRDMQGAPAHE